MRNTSPPLPNRVRGQNNFIKKTPTPPQTSAQTPAAKNDPIAAPISFSCHAEMPRGIKVIGKMEAMAKKNSPTPMAAR